jgi:hypothetical protein
MQNGCRTDCQNTKYKNEDTYTTDADRYVNCKFCVLHFEQEKTEQHIYAIVATYLQDFISIYFEHKEEECVFPEQELVYP